MKTYLTTLNFLKKYLLKGKKQVSAKLKDNHKILKQNFSYKKKFEIQLAY